MRGGERERERERAQSGGDRETDRETDRERKIQRYMYLTHNHRNPPPLPPPPPPPPPHTPVHIFISQQPKLIFQGNPAHPSLIFFFHFFWQYMSSSRNSWDSISRSTRHAPLSFCGGEEIRETEAAIRDEEVAKESVGAETRVQ